METMPREPLTHPLLTLAGIKSIPYDASGFLAPVYMKVPGEHREMPSLAFIGCWHGQDPLRLKAAMDALQWTLQSNPRPRIYIVEAARPSDKRFFDIPGVIYIPRTIQPQSEGIWMKEALWSIAARQAVKDGCTKLVFADLDCSFVRQDWALDVSKSFDGYDVICPQSCFYRAGQIEGVKLGLNKSNGYCHKTTGRLTGHPGIACGITAAFFTGAFKSRIMNAVDGSGDRCLWLKLRPGIAGNDPYTNRFSHVLAPADLVPLSPLPRIGCANQVMAHHPHGPQSNRHYMERYAITRECFPKFGDGVAYLEDGMPYYSDAARGAVWRKTTAIVTGMSTKGTAEAARELTRKNLKEAGLEVYGA